MDSLAWKISAEILHSKAYIGKYLRALVPLIGRKDASILDSACGTGFPSRALYEAGYMNLVCSDGDKESVESLRRIMSSENKPVQVHHASWQDIRMRIGGTFDVVLNVDNSLVYLDSWSGGTMARGEEEIFGRIIAVLENFRLMLKPGGRLIVALTKNNVRGIAEREVEIGEGVFEGKAVKVVWRLSYDWKRRRKHWNCVCNLPDGELVSESESYLVTGEELKGLLMRAGFKKVRMVESEGIYDNFLVAENAENRRFLSKMIDAFRL